MAGNHFFQQVDDDWLAKFEQFKSKHAAWLDDYSLFMTLKQAYNGISWSEWPENYRKRDKTALKEVSEKYAKTIAQIKFERFLFFTQWHELRAYANKKNVFLVGDILIYVAYDSADVWSAKEIFLLDEQGVGALFAGVPPGVFSDHG